MRVACSILRLTGMNHDHQDLASSMNNTGGESCLCMFIYLREQEAYFGAQRLGVLKKTSEHKHFRSPEKPSLHPMASHCHGPSSHSGFVCGRRFFASSFRVVVSSLVSECWSLEPKMDQDDRNENDLSFQVSLWVGPTNILRYWHSFLFAGTR